MSIDKYLGNDWVDFFNMPRDFSWHLSNTANVDMYEKEGHLYLNVPVPGMSNEEIKVRLEEREGKRYVHIVAKKEEEKKSGKKEGEVWYHKASYDREYRIALPKNVDLQKPQEASCKNGSLQVVFGIKGPEMQKSEGHFIPVKGSDSRD